MATALPPTTPAAPKPIAGRMTVGIAAATPTPAAVPTTAVTAVLLQDIGRLDGESFDEGSPLGGGSPDRGSFDEGSLLDGGSFDEGSLLGGGSSDGRLMKDHWLVEGRLMKGHC